MSDQITFVILKPDCVRKRRCGDVIGRFEAKGFDILAMEMRVLSRQVIDEHYSHLLGEAFYEALCVFMTSGPSVVLVLKGVGVVGAVREMLGATNCLSASKGTIRGDYGERDNVSRSSMYNIAHASDSADSALIEIRRFFPDFIVDFSV